MKAIIENGGIKYNGPAIFPASSDKWKMIIFNVYLNIVERCLNADELRKECSEFEFNLRYLEHKNPFTSGFTKDGFGVYLDDMRKIYCEVETDIEE